MDGARERKRREREGREQSSERRAREKSFLNFVFSPYFFCSCQISALFFFFLSFIIAGAFFSFVTDKRNSVLLSF